MKAALDSIEQWVVQQFYPLKSGRFFLLPPECEKCNTGHTPIGPRATPTTTRTGQSKSIFWLVNSAIHRFSLFREQGVQIGEQKK